MGSPFRGHACRTRVRCGTGLRTARRGAPAPRVPREGAPPPGRVAGGPGTDVLRTPPPVVLPGDALAPLAVRGAPGTTLAGAVDQCAAGAGGAFSRPVMAMEASPP
jgi:hypothetical protein